MDFAEHDHGSHAPRCCPCGHSHAGGGDISRRTFLGGTGMALGGLALTGLTWKSLAAAEGELDRPPGRKPLVVKPIFAYGTYSRRPQTSWRPWGGIETQEQADAEMGRIQKELEELARLADFPVQILPLAPVRNAAEMSAVPELATADVRLVYASSGGNALNPLRELNKDTIFFVRHKSGPVYLWYEIISPRFLRQHTDTLAVTGIDDGDVVVDSQEEILWRLRSLCGLRNTVGSRILAIGGPDAWAQPKDVVPNLVRDKWKMDIRTVAYEDLAKLIEQAMADSQAMALAKHRAAEYLKLPETTLETELSFVENGMLLDQIFRRLMKEADCGAITINGCMGTIMPMSKTTACLTLSTLNDDGYLAFCESDFVVIPSGMLLGGISGKPVFLNDPTYPHDGLITLAHCTAPRKMDGKTLEPARVLTHFESDYGAAPKVEMHNGQELTNIVPDFAIERWVGLSAEIVDHPFLPICRSQIDVRFKCDSQLLAERMPGFHWMTGYGNYLREVGYAIKRIPIKWDCLG